MDGLLNKSINTLELPLILEKLAAFAVCDEAKERSIKLLPANTIEDAKFRQTQTKAAKIMLEERGSPALFAIRAVNASLSRAALGGALNTRELLDIEMVLRAARSLKSYASSDKRPKSENSGKSALEPLFSRLSGNKALEDRITGCILSEEEIADGASPELSSIRRKIRTTGNRIREILNKYISSHSKFLQEALVTQRNGRYVIPVKSEHKSDVPGLLHDVSASGATLFIEPSAAVNAHNELRELESAERKEIERILYELSVECSEFGEALQSDYDTLAALDALFARAKLASDMSASMPLIEEGVINLRRAKHPLLQKDKAVPVSVHLGKDFNTLVITGPNTGGKTVTLKTIGLFTLMAACGLHLPAEEGSEITFARAVYADIGDEQSIAQSLSTFSSHMKNIVAILANAQYGDLVLFDELGAGTDPVEGAALAVAIIERTRALGCLIAATTHYAELKTYAMSTPGVENASCEFDVETLRPTYRLLIGVPGRSNAFAISSRLGLSEDIISAAKERIGIKDAAFEEILIKLENQRSEMEKDLAAAETARRESEELKRKNANLKALIEKEYEKAAENARAEAFRILNEARAAADEAGKEINRARAAAQSETLAETRQKLNQAERDLSINAPENLNEPEEQLFDAPPPVGTEVLLASTGIRATVTGTPDKNGMFPLLAGIMKVSASLDELRPCEPAKKKNISGGTVSHVASSSPVNMEIDLRGQMGEEGVLLMERFIDDAVLRRLNSITVIHGKGTGALRSACHAALKKNKSVKDFRLGRYGEGESGVTVVNLKSK